MATDNINRKFGEAECMVPEICMQTDTYTKQACSSQQCTVLPGQSNNVHIKPWSD